MQRITCFQAWLQGWLQATARRNAMDDYRCIQEIGVGAHATVNLAVALSCDHVIALKMIPLSTADPCTP
ncbi:hypothetical protein SPRG_10966 [Saprolegnia parasitica CBS 223.65]|uniref:Protein kinase domain-containing protein n=1 Tax=Saprolegnia parasitica (strain CBS 223.65) TaxID=695850 RepID=A0A067C5T3_SAPPC|nr:hypothetical protein SPRG_10966 [Saprolegnia parasitica CBS 223.65]KDO22147.1 hypothetical protein SPRG_10966 [Saprolegnia parasitica CBS 223.65]|eukprot:XP_012207184.1 hypothetical protein SPRG_10966 [Saprolegnia parasitica CBS 223.65]